MLRINKRSKSLFQFHVRVKPLCWCFMPATRVFVLWRLALSLFAVITIINNKRKRKTVHNGCRAANRNCGYSRLFIYGWCLHSSAFLTTSPIGALIVAFILCCAALYISNSIDIHGRSSLQLRQKCTSPSG
uniref:Secreted protein n=1 Tax=Heterorhabditis bacteriophora TaxID=37862 RepID=A0A1I7W727_HETBA